MIALASLLLVTSLAQKLPTAQSYLARADFLHAIAAAEEVLRTRPTDADASAVLSLLLADVDPTRAARLARVAARNPAPLPEIPSDDPPRTGQRGYVSVASAPLLWSAARNARLVTRVGIGTEVRVLSIQGAMGRLDIQDAGDGPAKGYMRLDQLTSTAPTLAGLLAKADALRPRGVDMELAMLWRAINLDARGPVVLDRLVASAFEARRFDVAVEGAKVATRSGRFGPSAPDPTSTDYAFSTAESLWVDLGRGAFAKSGALHLHLEHISRYVMMTNTNGESDGTNLTIAEYFGEARERSPLWPAVQRLLLSRPVVKNDSRWVFDSAGNALELTRGEGRRWHVTIFQLPGGHARAEQWGRNEWDERLEADRRVRAAAPGGALDITILAISGYDPVMVKQWIEGWSDRITPCLPRGKRADMSLQISPGGAVEFATVNETDEEPSRSCLPKAFRHTGMPGPAMDRGWVRFTLRAR